jgi:hypothetical protein
MNEMRVVEIVTEDFQARAIFYGDMPLKEMMRVSEHADPVKRVRSWVELMEKAILDPGKSEEFQELPFESAMTVCALYLKLEPVGIFE